MLVADQGVQTTWGSDDNVWVGILVLQGLNILHHWGSTVEDSGLDLWHVLAEASILVLDLVSQLTSVAHDENGALAGDWLDLLESGEDEDGSLTKTRLGLAEDVGAENCLRNADLLDCKSCRVR